MIPRTVGRPQPTEYAEYYRGYVEQVAHGDILEILAQQRDETLVSLGSVDESKAAESYAPGKWTIKEVIGHVTDVERIFAYRALCFARNEHQSQPGFDQDAYVTAANFNRRTLAAIAEEFADVRNASIRLFRGFDEDVWLQRGEANGVAFTVRAIAYILAGHELHHLGIVKQRYL